MQASDFQRKLEEYLCLLYVILGLGTFGLVVAGASYKGSENLLATRNITDTNVTMAYFVLLLPFALLFAERQKKNKGLITFALVLILLGVVIFSFSRGAALIIIPYLLVSVCLSSARTLAVIVLSFSVITFYIGPGIETAIRSADLTYFWKLRFGDLSVNSLFGKLLESSGRDEIHSIASKLFMRSPIVGHGTGSFEILGPGYREAHSMWYTLLAENGLLGAVLMYSMLGKCGFLLFKTRHFGWQFLVLPFAFVVYLIFNHTVGSVFVIIPAKSVTINCIAPILLLCLYFYAENLNCSNEEKAKSTNPG
jgi:hypothetical protein